MDVIGPIWPRSSKGHQYIFTIVNSCTQYCAGIPLKHKSDAPKSIAYAINMEAKCLVFIQLPFTLTEAQNLSTTL
jgi:hypothetical protein